MAAGKTMTVVTDDDSRRDKSTYRTADAVANAHRREDGRRAAEKGVGLEGIRHSVSARQWAERTLGVAFDVRHRAGRWEATWDIGAGRDGDGRRPYGELVVAVA